MQICIGLQLAPTSYAMQTHTCIRQLLDCNVSTTTLIAGQINERALQYNLHSSCIQLRIRRYIPMQRLPLRMYPDRQPHVAVLLSRQNCSQSAPTHRFSTQANWSSLSPSSFIDYSLCLCTYIFRQNHDFDEKISISATSSRYCTCRILGHIVNLLFQMSRFASVDLQRANIPYEFVITLKRPSATQLVELTSRYPL